MNVIELPCFYVLGELPEHTMLKPIILDYVDTHRNDSLRQNNGYYTDSITSLDWESSIDFSRAWAKALLPSLSNFLQNTALHLGYAGSTIHQLWFQQYVKGDTHGWHVHGCNFTGVYYVELDPTSPKTELVVPFKQQSIQVPNIKEGDVLIFPSFTVHRAPVLTNDLRKTIVSFNIDFNDINPSLLEMLREKELNT